MEKKRIVKTDSGHVIIAESVYAKTHSAYKGVWTTEREGCEEYMGKRTWMPPFYLFNTTCLLIEGYALTIIPDEEFTKRYGF